MENSNISSSDAVLLGLLQKNSRITNKELARAAGIAESTCLERVRSLQQRGVIRGWHADVDLAAIGRPIRALISVRLQPKTATSITAFQTEVLKVPETISLSTLTGADDFIVEVAVPDVDHLMAFVLEHIASRSNVSDTRTALVYEHRRKAVVAPVVSDL